MKVGALNQLKGKIVKHVPGAANTEVVFETPGGAQTVSTITKGRQSHQDLYVGQETYAIIKARNVIVAVGHCENNVVLFSASEGSILFLVNNFGNCGRIRGTIIRR